VATPLLKENRERYQGRVIFWDGQHWRLYWSHKRYRSLDAARDAADSREAFDGVTQVAAQ